jgi:hypothetical protein
VVIDCLVLFIRAEREYKPAAPARLDSSTTAANIKRFAVHGFHSRGRNE